MSERALELFAGRDIAGTPTPRAPFVAPILGEPVLGIDTSLTGYALCYSVPGRPLVEGEWSTDSANSVRERMARIEKLIRGTLEVALAQHPGLILIEGYAFAPAKKKRGRAHDRAELGGVLRWELCKRVTCPIVEVAPATLKKFTTGGGKATKGEMVSKLAIDHQRVFRTDNQADAFALCRLGLALTGQVPEPSTKAERTYLAGLRKSYGLKEVA